MAAIVDILFIPPMITRATSKLITIEVIKGSIGILNNIEYITGDFGFERGIDQSETYTEVKNILEKNNFELLKVSDQLTALFKNKNFN